MTIKCDHVVKARRPNIVVVEKERNKAIIIVDVGSLWDPGVKKKEGEKIDNKLLVLRFEDADWKTMGYQKAGSGMGSCWHTQGSKQKGWIKGLKSWGLPLRWDGCRKQLCWEQQGTHGRCWKGEEEGMTLGRKVPWCNVGITSTRTKALS